MAFDFKEDLVLLDPDFDHLLNSEGQEETMDIALRADIAPIDFSLIVSHRGPPIRANDPGPLNFGVEVNSSDVNKNKFLYSHRLNRIYVNMETNFPVQFQWDGAGPTAHMAVRACVVFADESQAEKRVERCVQHVHQASSAGLRPEIVNNVLHSSREMGTQGVYYCGDPALADSWYSVVVHLTKTGPEPCTHAYKFVCKNSCTSGINRRAVAIIFTLEDFYGVVHGRASVEARACACPRRDLRKDEEGEGVYRPGKRRVPANQLAQPPPPPPPPPSPPPVCKKIKIETLPDTTEDQLITLPPWKVVGKKAAIIGMEVMLNMMEQAERKNGDENSKHINDFRLKLQEFKKKPST